mgnify:CR=1 FL=1
MIYFGDGLTFGAEETERGSMIPMLIGLGVVLFTMAVWWIDVVKESHSGFHNKIFQIGLKYGMVLFIDSEVCFFVAFFWAFFETCFETCFETFFDDFLTGLNVFNNC